MKKLVSGIVIAAMVFSVGTISVFATSQTNGGNFAVTLKNFKGGKQNFADKDGDGVCDRRENATACLQNGLKNTKGSKQKIKTTAAFVDSCRFFTIYYPVLLKIILIGCRAFVFCLLACSGAEAASFNKAF